MNKTEQELILAAKAILEMYGPPSEYSFEARAAWERLRRAIKASERASE